MHARTASRLFFALTILAIGLIGLVRGEFGSIWDGVPKSLPDRTLLAGVASVISVAAGVGLLMKRTAAAAALALAAILMLWTVLFKLPFIIRAPLVEGSYQTTGQNLLLVAAIWTLFSGLSKDMRGAASPVAGEIGMRIAVLFYGFALVAFGLAQIVYPELTIPIVPRWLPDPPFWAYLTAFIYIVSGLAVVSGFAVRSMITMSALQITLITLFVWPTMMLTDQMTRQYRQEASQSWALTAGAWLMATWCVGEWWPRRLRSSAFALRGLAGG